MKTTKLSTWILILSGFIMLSCEKAFFEPEPENNPEALFEELWNTFKEGYGPFEERGVDWDEQYSIYRPQVNSNTTDEELYEVFSGMLRSLNDGHVALIVPDKKVFNSNIYFDGDQPDSLFNLDLITSSYLDPDFKENGYGGNTFGKISADDGKIGYWHVAWIGDNFLEIDEVLNSMEDCKGMIVDMRNNAGGDFTYAYSEFGRLVNETYLAHRSKTKNGPGEDDYTDWYEWNLYPEGSYFDKPIVLLTDRYTISAGERTVMAFKVLPNVVHLGDTTNGALSTKIPRELANGWFYSIAPQRIEYKDGTRFEGMGIPPDEYVANTMADIKNSKDVVLESAIGKF